MSDEKPVVEKLEPIPDFEGMSILQLLQYDQSLKDQDKCYGTTEHFDKWMSAVQDSIPFYGIIETLSTIEDQFYELQAQFERLVIALDNQLEPVKVSLKEWIKR